MNAGETSQGGAVVLLGALDTKGDEFAFLRDGLASLGVPTITVDTGVMGVPAFQPDVPREDLVAAAGADLARLQTGEHKDEAMAAMARGAAAVVRALYDEGRVAGIVGMGGTGGTAVATSAMRALPVGVPKLMVSTVAGGDVSPYVDVTDITMMPSIVDVAGFNRISRAIYTNALGAIAGMVGAQRGAAPAEDKPVVAASMFGNTTACVDRARQALEGDGYEVLVFHATGTGGRTMDGLIADGFVDLSLDLTTTELADDVCGGVFNAGADRCLAAARAGIPTVLAPGCVDMANFGGPDTVPAKYEGRNLYRWNDNVTLLRTNAEENQAIGERIAAAANAASGPVSILLPLRGVSMLDSEGNEFWDPEADNACFDAIRKHVADATRVIEVDANINDPEFADAAVAELRRLAGKE